MRSASATGVRRPEATSLVRLMPPIGITLVFWYLFSRTLWGFRLRVTGLGPRAAQVSGGIDSQRVGAVALLLMGLFFNPWLLAGIAISAGILYAGFQALPQA